MMDYKEAYYSLIERLKEAKEDNALCDERYCCVIDGLIQEQEENEDERIRKELITHFRNTRCVTEEGAERIAKWISWLEKQDNKELVNFDEAEKEKFDFVGDGFIRCFANFLDFKEGNTYWLEYIGDDKYNVRSDNLLGKTYHITPCQLYTIFKKMTWLEKQSHQKIVNDTNENMVKAVKKKFKAGDWITDGQLTCKVLSATSKFYELHLYNDDYCHFKTDAQSVDKHHHIWTIKDAKDGDILTANIHHWEIDGDIEKLPVIVPTIFIYQEVKTDNKNIHAYVSLFDNTSLNIYRSMYYIDKYGIKDIHPATKTERDTLMKAMAEAGYTFDFKSKQLKKL